MSSQNNSFHHPAVPNLRIGTFAKKKKEKQKKSPTFSHPSLPVKQSEYKQGEIEKICVKHISSDKTNSVVPDGAECRRSSLSETGETRREIFRQLSKIRSIKDLQVTTKGRRIDLSISALLSMVHRFLFVVIMFSSQLV